MSLDDVLAKLDKKTRDRVSMGADAVIERIPTASIGLNVALKGGFARGRQTLIYGNKSAGKSSMLLQTIAKAQKEGLVCAWVDAEASFDPDWAARLGVNTEELIILKDKAINDMIASVCDLLDAEIDLIVVDSISSTLPSTYFEKEDEMQDGLAGTKQIGAKSKELGIAVNKFNYANKNTVLLLISQMRNQFSTYGASLKPDGGQAMMFFSSTVIKLWSSASDKEQIKDEILNGSNFIQQNVGRKVNWTVEYNKVGPPGQIGEYDFYYDGEEVGLDSIGEIADLAAKHGVVSRSKSGWYTYDDEKIQGRPKFVAWLKDNVTKREEIEAKLWQV